MSTGKINVRVLVVPIDQSGFNANCYLVGREDSNQCVLIDAPAQPDLLLQEIGGKELVAIILTHNHFDHVGAAAALVKATGATVYAHELDADIIEQGSRDTFASVESIEGVKVDVGLKGGEKLDLAGVKFDVLHTPGHSKGSICLLNNEEKVLFSGDTLFKGTTGRTDFAGGSPVQMHDSLIELSKLADDVIVLPGHDAHTTIAAERTRALIEY